MTTITPEMKQRIMDELRAVDDGMISENDITIYTIMNELKCGESRAKQRVQVLIDAHRLKIVPKNNKNGKPTDTYVLVEPPEPTP